MSDEQKKRELRENEEALARQLQEQVGRSTWHRALIIPGCVIVGIGDRGWGLITRSFVGVGIRERAWDLDYMQLCWCRNMSMGWGPQLNMDRWVLE